MTRRCLVTLLASGAVSTSCAPANRAETLAKLRDMAERENLAMIGGWQSLDAGGSVLIPDGRSVMGAEVGQLALPDRPYWRSVSADGTWVAWVPLSSLPYPVGGGHPLVLFADDPRSARTLRFKGLCASQVAASSKAAHVALVAVLDKAGYTSPPGAELGNR